MSNAIISTPFATSDIEYSIDIEYSMRAKTDAASAL